MYFLKKYSVPIIANDGEHTCRIEDKVSPLQLFSCIQEEAYNVIALHTSKSSGNVAIEAKDTEFLMLLIYSYSK